MAMVEIIRGDTLQIPARAKEDGAAVDLTGWEIRSQIRKPAKDGGALIANLAVSVTSAVDGEIWLQAAATVTSAWPIGAAEMDIEFKKVSDGYVRSTPKISVLILGDVTHD